MADTNTSPPVEANQPLAALNALALEFARWVLASPMAASDSVSAELKEVTACFVADEQALSAAIQQQQGLWPLSSRMALLQRVRSLVDMWLRMAFENVLAAFADEVDGLVDPNNKEQVRELAAARVFMPMQTRFLPVVFALFEQTQRRVAQHVERVEKSDQQAAQWDETCHLQLELLELAQLWGALLKALNLHPQAYSGTFREYVLLAVRTMRRTDLYPLATRLVVTQMLAKYYFNAPNSNALVFMGSPNSQEALNELMDAVFKLLSVDSDPATREEAPGAADVAPAGCEIEPQLDMPSGMLSNSLCGGALLQAVLSLHARTNCVPFAAFFLFSAMKLLSPPAEEVAHAPRLMLLSALTVLARLDATAAEWLREDAPRRLAMLLKANLRWLVESAAEWQVRGAAAANLAECTKNTPHIVLSLLNALATAAEHQSALHLVLGVVEENIVSDSTKDDSVFSTARQQILGCAIRMCSIAPVSEITRDSGRNVVTWLMDLLDLFLTNDESTREDGVADPASNGGRWQLARPDEAMVDGLVTALRSLMRLSPNNVAAWSAHAPRLLELLLRLNSQCVGEVPYPVVSPAAAEALADLLELMPREAVLAAWPRIQSVVESAFAVQVGIESSEDRAASFAYVQAQVAASVAEVESSEEAGRWVPSVLRSRIALHQTTSEADFIGPMRMRRAQTVHTLRGQTISLLSRALALIPTDSNVHAAGLAVLLAAVEPTLLPGFGRVCKKRVMAGAAAPAAQESDELTMLPTASDERLAAMAALVRIISRQPTAFVGLYDRVWALDEGRANAPPEMVRQTLAFSKLLPRVHPLGEAAALPESVQKQAAQTLAMFFAQSSQGADAALLAAVLSCVVELVKEYGLAALGSDAASIAQTESALLQHGLLILQRRHPANCEDLDEEELGDFAGLLAEEAKEIPESELEVARQRAAQHRQLHGYAKRIGASQEEQDRFDVVQELTTQTCALLGRLAKVRGAAWEASHRRVLRATSISSLDVHWRGPMALYWALAVEALAPVPSREAFEHALANLGVKRSEPSILAHSAAFLDAAFKRIPLKQLDQFVAPSVGALQHALHYVDETLAEPNVASVSAAELAQWRDAHAALTAALTRASP